MAKGLSEFAVSSAVKEFGNSHPPFSVFAVSHTFQQLVLCLEDTAENREMNNFPSKFHVLDVFGRLKLTTFDLFGPSVRLVSSRVLKRYLEEKIYPKLEERPFSVVYMHTGAQRGENFPGIATVRSIYEAIPIDVKRNLEVVYFVHPDLQARLFLATLGRLLFSGG